MCSPFNIETFDLRVSAELCSKASSLLTMNYDLIFWGYTLAIQKITRFAQAQAEFSACQLSDRKTLLLHNVDPVNSRLCIDHPVLRIILCICIFFRSKNSKVQTHLPTISPLKTLEASSSHHWFHFATKYYSTNICNN